MKHEGNCGDGGECVKELQKEDLFPVDVKLNSEQAQNLLNQLWRSGLRPTIFSRSFKLIEQQLPDIKKVVSEIF